MKKNKKDLVGLLEITPEQLQRAHAAYASTDPGTVEPSPTPAPGPIVKSTLASGGQAGDPTEASAEWNDELEDTVASAFD